MLRLFSERFADEYVLEFQDGETIFKEGDEGREMYIVQKGEVDVVKQGAWGEVLLAVLRQGDFVGEMALLESMPRSATANAKGHTRLLVLQPGGFLLKIRRDPTLAFEMLQHLSRRIRTINDRLLEALNQGASAETMKKIVGAAEYSPEE